MAPVSLVSSYRGSPERNALQAREEVRVVPFNTAMGERTTQGSAHGPGSAQEYCETLAL
jgi:hypothetical protein